MSAISTEAARWRGALTQDDEPEEPEKLPLAHEVQIEEPTVLANEPTSAGANTMKRSAQCVAQQRSPHATQAERPDERAYRPAEQFVHCDSTA